MGCAEASGSRFVDGCAEVIRGGWRGRGSVGVRAVTTQVSRGFASLAERRKKRLRQLVGSVSVVSVIVFLSGCATTTLRPPVEPDEPRAVFLVDHGRHSSLVISRSDGDLVRYAYGDWRYYADQDTSLASGAAALLWPTPATLARAELEGPAEVDVLRGQLRVGVENIYVFEVAGSDADRVGDELDALHLEGEETHQYVAAYDMTFAPHPEPYTLLNNSASVLARWLESMGVEVDGPALVASWRVGDQAPR